MGSSGGAKWGCIDAVCPPAGSIYVLNTPPAAFSLDIQAIFVVSSESKLGGIPYQAIYSPSSKGLLPGFLC